MSHKDGDQTATTTRAWQPIVLGEWTTDSPIGDQWRRCPFFPVQVNFVRTTKYNIAMVSKFCWPSVNSKQNYYIFV